MPEVASPDGDRAPADHPQLPATAGLDGFEYHAPAAAALEPESPAVKRVGLGFISLYTLAYLGTSLLDGL